MIVVTRLTGDRFGINSDLIQRVESAPDTIVTLVDGTKYIVAEPLVEVIGLIDERAAQVLARSQELRSTARLMAVPDRDDDERIEPPAASSTPERVMDPAGLIGIGVALSAIFGAMILEGAQPMSIMLPAPLLLVWLGTLGVGVAGHTLRDVKNAFAAVPRALRSKAPDPSVTVDTVVSLADRARREGLLALEDAARDIDDEFLRTGLQAAIDGTDPEDLRIILEDRIATKRTQEKVNSKYFQDMGGYAPTIGIIGTVISLVHVLENLSEPATLGHSIAAAFVATLWGILSANVVWLPLSARIKRISDLECAHMEVTLEGLLAVQAGANPRVVGERLRSLIPHDMVAEPRQAAA